MDKTSKYFDHWAKIGKSEDMEKGHGATVNKFLNKIPFNDKFSFLDIGCGNGWVVKKMVQLDTCTKAVGIDKSKNMINKANKTKISDKEQYFTTELETSRFSRKFDVIFSMESLYY